MNTIPPLILITNDDGITSPGLRATVEAVLPLGEPLVVAPDRQWSGAGRSMPPGTEDRIARYPLEVDGRSITAYQVSASPAQAVLHGLLELAPQPPALLISGINFGENLGSDVTISGTVGAALQGAVGGVPSMAVSLQTPKENHAHHSDDVDFAAAVYFTRLFAQLMLRMALPFDVDVLKIDVPDDATQETAWRLTRASRYSGFNPIPSVRTNLAAPSPIDYEPAAHPERAEPDSDLYAMRVERVVSVTPLSLDLTSRADFGDLESLLCGAAGALTRCGGVL